MQQLTVNMPPYKEYAVKSSLVTQPLSYLLKYARMTIFVWLLDLSSYRFLVFNRCALDSPVPDSRTTEENLLPVGGNQQSSGSFAMPIYLPDLQTTRGEAIVIMPSSNFVDADILSTSVMWCWESCTRCSASDNFQDARWLPGLPEGTEVRWHKSLPGLQKSGNSPGSHSIVFPDGDSLSMYPEGEPM